MGQLVKVNVLRSPKSLEVVRRHCPLISLFFDNLLDKPDYIYHYPPDWIQPIYFGTAGNGAVKGIFKT
jgi:hypothetical protein